METHPPTVSYNRNTAQALITAQWKDLKDLHFDKLKLVLQKDISLPNSHDELQKLNCWFRNEKRRQKNKLCPSTASAPEIIVKQEQADQLLAKQEDQLLGRLSDLTEEKKRRVLKEQLDDNFLMILQFMSDQNNSPCDNFLPIMLDLCEDMEIQHNQTLLFLKICASYQDELLLVNEKLMVQGFLALALQTLDQRAAYGLLKLAFRNNISFKSFKIDALVAFQEKYTQQIKGFYKTLKLPYQVVECLPPTCFVLTSPFFDIFKQGGALLYQNVEPAYLTFFIEILSYSFENDMNVFQQFLQAFKSGCINIYLKKINLQSLLQRLTEEEISRNQKFFGSLKNHLTLFNHLFEMINESKIDYIDEGIIEELVLLQEETYIQRKQAPKNIKNSGDFDKTLSSYIQQLALLNKKEVLLDLFEASTTTSKGIVSLAKQFGIQELTHVQLTAIKLIEFYLINESYKLCQCLETGTGKTTLSLILMLNIVETLKIQCCAIYSSNDLCLRDFNRLNSVAHALKISVAYVKADEDFFEVKNSQILFMSAGLYQKLSKEGQHTKLFSQQALVIDEFDQIIFDDSMNQQVLLSFAVSKYLFAFTGSPLQEVHQCLIREGLKSSFIKHPSSGRFDGKENRCLGESIFANRKLQLKHLADLCKDQSLKTPVLLILDANAHKKFLNYYAKSVPFRNLSQMSPDQIDSFLKTAFLMKENGRYFTCLISDKQGRGLDAPSNQEIESQGGIAVIIAQTPKNKQELEQFKGRTKRMGNNGQHFLVLFEKGFKESCKTFLDFTLQTAKTQEQVKLSNILAIFRSHQLKGLEKENVEEQKILDEELNNDNQAQSYQLDADVNNHEANNIVKDQENPLKEVKIQENFVVLLPRDDLKEFQKQHLDEAFLENGQTDIREGPLQDADQHVRRPGELTASTKIPISSQLKLLRKRTTHQQVKEDLQKNKRQRLTE